jgi:dihydroorotate dehydrogenase
MYNLLRSFLFLFDPEKVHYFLMNGMKFFCKIPFIKKWIANKFTPPPFPAPTFQLFNLAFKNPVGLGAGFDKNAMYLNELEALGFGFVEIGTVTPLPQAGNDKPRLFRLPKDKAIINRMGFNNDGVEVISERLKQWNNRPVNKSYNPRLIIGGNIGKNKITPNEDAWKDYEICFTALHDQVDYFVVNVSSPNTPGLRELQEKDSLYKILQNLQRLNSVKEKPKPILLKIAPDLSISQIDDVIELALEIKLDGLVVANTTIDRSNLTTDNAQLKNIGAGGLSGQPLKQRSTELVTYIHHKTKGNIPINYLQVLHWCRFGQVSFTKALQLLPTFVNPYCKFAH